MDDENIFDRWFAKPLSFRHHHEVRGEQRHILTLMAEQYFVVRWMSGFDYEAESGDPHPHASMFRSMADFLDANPNVAFHNANAAEIGGVGVGLEVTFFNMDLNSDKLVWPEEPSDV